MRKWFRDSKRPCRRVDNGKRKNAQGLPPIRTPHAKQALTEAGISDTHAGVIVAMTRDALTEGVATKADITDLKTDIAKLESNMLRLAVVTGNAALTAGLLLI